MNAEILSTTEVTTLLESPRPLDSEVVNTRVKLSTFPLETFCVIYFFVIYSEKCTLPDVGASVIMVLDIHAYILLVL